MQLVSIEISGFKSFGRKTTISFNHPITAIVGPNGSGKSNVAEAIRFVLGEQSMKSMRGKTGTDLIFKGSHTLSPLGRASVTALFDNRKTKNTHLAEGVFSYLGFDEIRITREIYADGANEYSINDTKVRLKDVQELLSTANIGSSGHHMISQGEADRVLSANAKEKREMIEDALGLKLYGFRIKEAERKLEKTEINLREGEVARRELAPHLNYLKRQVEKIHERKNHIDTLSKLFAVYLHREENWLKKEQISLSENGGRAGLLAEKDSLEEGLERITKSLSADTSTHDSEILLKVAEESFKQTQQKNLEIQSEYIRLEAEERVLRKNLEAAVRYETELQNKKASVSIEKEAVITTQKNLDTFYEQASWRLSQNEYLELPQLVQGIKLKTNHFFTELLSQDASETGRIYVDSKEIEKDLADIHTQKHQKQIDLEVVKKEVEDKEKEVQQLRQTIAETKETFHTEEKALYEYKNRLTEINSKLLLIDKDLERFSKRKEAFDNEIAEGVALVGSDLYNFSEYTDTGEETKTQAELYRSIERLKIKLEEAQVGNASDLQKEYQETSERDTFLRTQIEDLLSTKTHLESLLQELRLKLEEEFTVGVEKINRLFNVYFTDMFGGGEASLFEVERAKRTRRKEVDELDVSDTVPEEELESGVDIKVSLPQKKVRDLSMLSGGERALTSIALLFAISGVNPPPFMVLDETDAALDEANARRYGKSLKHLSDHSKLVVITHNRETMNSSDALYGVTVGKDGSSKVLSVAFEEATEYAK